VDKLRAALVGLSGLVGAVPCIAALKGVGSPPQFEAIYAVVLEAVSVLTLAVLLLSANHIAGARKQVIGFMSAVLVALVLAALPLYRTLFDRVYVEHDFGGKSDVIMVPLFPSDTLAALIAQSGSARAAVMKYGPDRVRDLAAQGGTFATQFALILVYAGIAACLTAAPGLMAIRLPVSRSQADP
jgi:hypothetical protein